MRSCRARFLNGNRMLNPSIARLSQVSRVKAGLSPWHRLLPWIACARHCAQPRFVAAARVIEKGVHLLVLLCTPLPPGLTGSSQRVYMVSRGVAAVSHDVAQVSHRCRTMSRRCRTVSHRCRNGVAPVSHGVARCRTGVAPVSHGVARCRACRGVAPVSHGVAPVSYTHLTLPTNREV